MQTGQEQGISLLFSSLGQCLALSPCSLCSSASMLSELGSISCLQSGPQHWISPWPYKPNLSQWFVASKLDHDTMWESALAIARIVTRGACKGLNVGHMLVLELEYALNRLKTTPFK